MLRSMSKVRRSIPDEWLRDNRVDSLPPDTLLVAEQAAELLACSVDTLLDRRRDGRPPPFRQEKARGRVKYPLGGVLAARQSSVFSSADQARATHTAEALGYPAPVAKAGASTFVAFIDSALPKDEWLFTFVDGKPADFFASLGVEQSEGAEIVCTWLSLTEYLAERSRWGAHQEAVVSRADLVGLLPDIVPLDATGPAALCERGCGRPSHPGRTCRM